MAAGVWRCRALHESRRFGARPRGAQARYASIVVQHQLRASQPIEVLGCIGATSRVVLKAAAACGLRRGCAARALVATAAAPPARPANKPASSACGMRRRAPMVGGTIVRDKNYRVRKEAASTRRTRAGWRAARGRAGRGRFVRGAGRRLRGQHVTSSTTKRPNDVKRAIADEANNVLAATAPPRRRRRTAPSTGSTSPSRARRDSPP